MSMSKCKYADITGKAPLVTCVMNGEVDQHDFTNEYFNKKYTASARAEDIVSKTADRRKNVVVIAKEALDEDIYDLFIKSEFDEISGTALDYLIAYAGRPHGGLLCYELQRELKELMVELRSVKGVPRTLLHKLKKSELGAMQQMTKGLLAAVQAMKTKSENQVEWLSKIVTCDYLLNVAKDLAGECLAARRLHGNECCNIFAAAAVAKTLAIILKHLNDVQAKRVFIEALKLYKEARGSTADPKKDSSMQDLFQAFGLANITLQRVNEDVATEDSSHNCSVCLSRPVAIIYTACGHACLCETCSNTTLLPGNEVVLESCPICRQTGPRTRFAS